MTAVSVLHYKFDYLTYMCLDSCYKVIPKDSPIFVIDNGSEEPFKPRAADRNALTDIVTNPQRGSFADGWNLSAGVLEACDEEFVWCLNNDVVLNELSYQPLLEAMQSDDSLAIVAPTYSAGGDWKLNHNLSFDPSYVPHDRMIDRVEYTDWVDITAWFVRRKALQELGYLDAERFTGHSWGSDISWCNRAMERDWHIGIVHSAFIWHMGGVTYGALEGGVQQYIANAQAERIANETKGS